MGPRRARHTERAEEHDRGHDHRQALRASERSRGLRGSNRAHISAATVHRQPDGDEESASWVPGVTGGVGLANFIRLTTDLMPASGLAGTMVKEAAGGLGLVQGTANVLGGTGLAEGQEFSAGTMGKGALQLLSAGSNYAGTTATALAQEGSVGAALGGSAVGTAGALASAGLAGYGVGTAMNEYTSSDETAESAWAYMDRKRKEQGEMSLLEWHESGWDEWETYEAMPGIAEDAFVAGGIGLTEGITDLFGVDVFADE